MTRFAILAALALLAGCATPETRIRTKLVDLGFERNQAACMADHVADRLSLGQLRTLSKLSGMSDKRIGDMTVGELSRLLNRSGNAEMVAIFARAGIGCALMG